MNAPSHDGFLRRRHGFMTAELARIVGPHGLGQVPARMAPTSTTDLVCGFCSTGCSLRAHLRDGAAVNLSPSPDYPVNMGMACPKGWEALTPLAAPDRATVPMARRPDGQLAPLTWAEAADLFVHHFKRALSTHGPESIAFLSTGQICTEEMALLGALFKFGMGGIHGDSNTRQCMATTHVAYKEALGFDAPPYTYADFEHSDVLVFIGSNLCIAHPILWQRVLRNPHRPRIIVIDPRRTETAAAATHHLPIRPKSDLVLLYGLANVIIQSRWHKPEFIRAHTSGFDEFAEFVRTFTPDHVAAETGLSVGEILRTAELIGRGRAVSLWWTMGVNQGHQAVRTAQAIINLALITGNIGRPGTGPNSITGQCNAMGSRLFSNTGSLFGGRDFSSPEDRAEIARILRIPQDRIPRRPSIAYDQIMDRVADGRIRALWVIGTNGAHSWIHSAAFRQAVRGLDFLAVQDLYTTTDTARLAHLLLPAAGWGEKDGTFINSERRIGLVRKVARAPGGALSDFAIFRLIAEAWGCGGMFTDWRTPEAVFQILKSLSKGLPCDFSGIRDYAHLRECRGIQWPFPASASASAELTPPDSERRLFEDFRFFTAGGRAAIRFEPPAPPPGTPTAEFPMVLLTGRGTSAQWHTQTRTGKSDILRQLYPARCYVEIHPEDADRLGISESSAVEIRSRKGAITATAFVAGTVQPGQVFLPMHYAEVNQLTEPAFDTYSRQPSYKYCAVRVSPAASDP